jgi:hypothetical protein
MATLIPWLHGSRFQSPCRLERSRFEIGGRLRVELNERLWR